MILNTRKGFIEIQSACDGNNFPAKLMISQPSFGQTIECEVAVRDWQQGLADARDGKASAIQASSHTVVFLFPGTDGCAIILATPSDEIAVVGSIGTNDFALLLDEWLN